MKSRYVAACLLLLTGIIHLFSPALFSAPWTPLVVMMIFGVIYLVIGILVLLGKRAGCYLGVIVPIVGIIMGTFGMVSDPAMATFVMFLLIAIDIAVLVLCIFLIKHKGEAVP